MYFSQLTVQITRLLTLCFCLGLLVAYRPAPLGSHQMAVDPDSEEFRSIQIEENLGERVDIENLVFTNESGEKVRLSQYFSGKKPVAVIMQYYACPSLCSLLLNGINDAFRRMDWTIGDQFEVVTVSISAHEGPELAARKKDNYIKDYGRLEGASGWHFLTGEEDQIEALASQIGFGFRWVEEIKEYAHSAGFFILTPEGVISRVFYGVMFEPRDVKLALLEASNGRTGSFADRILMFCYRYDPSSGGYALHAMTVMKAGGALTLLFLGIYLFVFWWRQRNRSERSQA